MLPGSALPDISLIQSLSLPFRPHKKNHTTMAPLEDGVCMYRLVVTPVVASIDHSRIVDFIKNVGTGTVLDLEYVDQY